MPTAIAFFIDNPPVAQPIFLEPITCNGIDAVLVGLRGDFDWSVSPGATWSEDEMALDECHGHGLVGGGAAE